MSKRKDIHLDPRNARIHDDKNKAAIKQSLSELGAGRSVIMDNDNIMIAGNGVYEQAQELGLPVKIIENDGSELIIIKRTDLSTDDAKRKALAIADNKLNDMSFFDFDKLKAELEQININDFDLTITGFQDFELGFLDEFVENPETSSGKLNESNTFEVEPGMGEYQNMPEYNQQDIDQYKLIVHFRSLQEKIDFADLVGQQIFEATKAIWFPKLEPIVEKDYICETK